MTTRPKQPRHMLAHPREHHHRAIAGSAILTAFLLITAFWVWSRVPAAISVERRVVDLTSFRLEIADTNETRQHGLSGHEPLKLEEGMLFNFPEARIYPFWMKEMRFDLDIVWIRQGQVVEVATLLAPDPEDLVPATHVPTQKADQVLEINAGRAKQLGLEPGAIVVLP